MTHKIRFFDKDECAECFSKKDLERCTLCTKLLCPTCRLPKEKIYYCLSCAIKVSQSREKRNG